MLDHPLQIQPTVIKKETVSELCYVRPFHLKMLQFAILAQASYVNIHPRSQFQKLIQEFFGETQNKSYGPMTVNQMSVPNTKYKFGAMTIFTFPDLNLVIVSIRGSYEDLDWKLDIQLFLSSALLSICSPLGLFSSSWTPYTYTAIRYILGVPINILRDFTLIQKYYESLKSFYEDQKIEESSNIIFIGHSLGGGLAKLFGYVYHRPAIAISGPGISILQTIYRPLDSYPEIQKILNLQTDIIPDWDPVPRVELSTGVRYQVLCQNPTVCHSLDHTICMIGIMCETEHDHYCKSLNSGNIPSIYDEMRKYAISI